MKKAFEDVKTSEYSIRGIYEEAGPYITGSHGVPQLWLGVKKNTVDLYKAALIKRFMDQDRDTRDWAEWKAEKMLEMLENYQQRKNWEEAWDWLKANKKQPWTGPRDIWHPYL